MLSLITRGEDWWKVFVISSIWFYIIPSPSILQYQVLILSVPQVINNAKTVLQQSLRYEQRQHDQQRTILPATFPLPDIPSASKTRTLVP